MNPVLVGWLEPREYEDEAPSFIWVGHIPDDDTIPDHWVRVYTDGEVTL